MSKHATATVAEPEVTTEPKTRRLPPYNVVILNDEEHTFPYVIEMLIKLFRHDLPKAEELTWRIHTTGRAVVYTTHKELAELKRDQVIAYGADPLSSSIPRARCAATSSRRPWIDRNSPDRARRLSVALESRSTACAQGGRQAGRDVGIDQLEPSPAFIR